MKVDGGHMQIEREGQQKKFCSTVAEKTFAASSANGRRILYVTERAVFQLLGAGGLELIEIAPGIDVKRDVIAQMEFRPAIANNLKIMDPRIFQRRKE